MRSRGSALIHAYICSFITVEQGEARSIHGTLRGSGSEDRQDGAAEGPGEQARRRGAPSSDGQGSMKKSKEGSGAEERTESKAFEKKEDKGKSKRGFPFRGSKGR